MPGAIEAVKEIMEVEAVVVFTARTDLVDVAAWLRAQDIECVTQDEWDAERPAEEHGSAFWNEKERVLVTNRKPAARVYLDDRAVKFDPSGGWAQARSEEHTSELQYLMRISYAVFCLKK